jgi:hypothetical protein
MQNGYSHEFNRIWSGREIPDYDYYWVHRKACAVQEAISQPDLTATERLVYSFFVGHASLSQELRTSKEGIARRLHLSEGDVAISIRVLEVTGRIELRDRHKPLTTYFLTGNDGIWKEPTGDLVLLREAVAEARS